jgi:hypothetical protein
VRGLLAKPTIRQVMVNIGFFVPGLRISFFIVEPTVHLSYRPRNVREELN